MTPQNPHMSLITLLILLPLIITAHANDSNKACEYSSNSSLRLVTKDVIKSSIREIRDTRKFVQSIPRLKSLQEKDSNEVLKCVVGLIDCISDIHSILNRMRHLKRNFIPSDTKSLKQMASRVLSFSQVCNPASNYVNGIIASMLDRKLVGTALVINDVVNLVSKLEH